MESGANIGIAQNSWTMIPAPHRNATVFILKFSNNKGRILRKKSRVYSAFYIIARFRIRMLSANGTQQNVANDRE